jgi:NAD(P)-dependent dehydrogenase (short-subunit alcohol dehydrogenase family)
VAVRSDVSKLEDLDRLYKEVAAKKGKIDILFANAGIVETVETPAATPEHFDRTFNTNARGVYFTVQKALPLLNDGASIILTSSVVWHKGMPIYGSYAATKAAIRSFCSHLGSRVCATRNPRKRDQPGTDRNAHL